MNNQNYKGFIKTAADIIKEALVKSQTKEEEKDK